MWKRILSCSSFVFASLFPLFFPTISIAACGGEPALPAEGLSWPATGPISVPWGLECRTDRGHRGIDIAVSYGDSIRASASGVVIFAGYTPAEGGGTTVSIEHQGGMRTTYLHLEHITVSQGQFVSQGQELGSSDGSPLHFGMKVNSPREAYFNPAIYLMPTGSSADIGQVSTEVSEPAPENAAVPGPSPELIAAGLPAATMVATVTSPAAVISEAISQTADPALPTVPISSLPLVTRLSDGFINPGNDIMNLGDGFMNPGDGIVGGTVAGGNIHSQAYQSAEAVGIVSIVSRMFGPANGTAVSATQNSSGETRADNRQSLVPGGHSPARIMLLCALLFMSALGITSLGNLPGLKPASTEPGILLQPVSC